MTYSPEHTFVLHKNTIKMCYNMHTDSRFKSLSTVIMIFTNRPLTNKSFDYNNSKIFMQNILLLNERNFTYASQE